MTRQQQFLCILAALAAAPQMAEAATVVRTLPATITGEDATGAFSVTFDFDEIVSADQLVSISGGSINTGEGASLAIDVNYTNGATAEIFSHPLTWSLSINLANLTNLSFASGDIDGLTFRYSFEVLPGSFTIPEGTEFTFRAADPPGGIPEPATWALMIAGFGSVGAMMRSRRREAPGVQACCGG